MKKTYPFFEKQTQKRALSEERLTHTDYETAPGKFN